MLIGVEYDLDAGECRTVVEGYEGERFLGADCSDPAGDAMF